MRNTTSSIRRRFLALWLLLALILPLPTSMARAEDGEGEVWPEDGAEAYDPTAELAGDYQAAGEATAGEVSETTGDGALAADLSGSYMPTADMETADIVIGYVAPAGAAISPAVCTEWSLVNINQLIFESVVDLDASMKPIPMLADSWEQEGKTWVFKLRPGVQFHNGMELTAYDVVRSYETLITSYADNPWYGRLTAIASMEATDIYNVTVVGTTAGLATLYAMNFPVMQYNTLGDAMPRGTGPYWFIQRDLNDTIRLEANPLWWKKQPTIHSLLFKRFNESGDVIEAVHTHQIDMMATNSSKAAFSRKMADLTSMDYLTQTYELLIPNLSEKSIFSDLRARKAVMYAIDRAVLTSNAYLDMAVQCEVPVPPTCWLYESQSAYYYYSPERALQLMHELEWFDLNGDGTLNKVNGVRLVEPDLTIITYNESTNSVRENAANLIANYLRAIGVSCTVYVRSQARVRQLIKDRAFDLALVGFNLSEVPDLMPIFGRNEVLNLNGFGNDDMQTYLEAVRDSSDETLIKDNYSRMQKYIVDRLPVLGMVFRTGTVLSNRSLGGLTALRNYDTFNGFEFLMTG